MKSALAVFLLALAAHLTYFALDRNHVAPDTHKYVVPAENMLAGRGFSRDGLPETQRTPGYPLMIAACRAAGLELRGIALLQHVLSSAAAAALFLLARRMTGNAFIAWIAGIVTAIDLPTIHHANNILTETLFALLLLLLFALVWHNQSIAAGLLLGAMTLVRPVAMLFFIPLALYLRGAPARRRAGGAHHTTTITVIIFIACSLLLPAAWLYRNYRVAGAPTLSTNSAVLLLYFHAAGALAIDDPGDFDANLERRQAELRRIADACLPEELRVRDVDAPAYIRRAASDARLGREIVLAHPVAFAKLFLRGIAINLLGGGAEALTRVTTLSRPAANRLLLVYTSLALLLAMIGEARLLKTNRQLAVLIAITVGYFIVFTAGALSYSRFRVPVVPIYAIAIGAGANALREAWLKQAVPVQQ